MNDFEIVAGVFAAVFMLGIGMGVLVVIAMSALRRHRDHRQRDGQGPWYKGNPPGEGPRDDGDPERPHWPKDGSL